MFFIELWVTVKAALYAGKAKANYDLATAGRPQRQETLAEKIIFGVAILVVIALVAAFIVALILRSTGKIVF